MVIALVFLLGLAVGSFLNVVVLRLQAGESLRGRSHCRTCLKELRWYHNVPLLSFAWLKGRCAYCQVKLSWQYPLVEFMCGVLYAVGAVVLPAGDWLGWAAWAVGAAFAVALLVYDLRFGELPDIFTLGGALVVLGLNVWRGRPLAGLVLAAVATAGFFALQYAVSRGTWIGSGDIRLGVFMGVSLGWPGVLVAVALAYWSGALVALVLVALKRKRMQDTLPFGVFLSAATLVAWLWGPWLWEWYLQHLVW